MHRIVAASLLLATAVSAFAPTATLHQQRSSSSSSLHTPTLHATKLAALPSIPNPFQQLPWNVEKAQKSKERKLKLERSRLHRELGIAEDATYEEINEATETMIARADGDLKRKIQIEVIKDKILQIRLNERLAGMTSDIVTKDAKAQSGFESTGYVNAKQNKSNIALYLHLSFLRLDTIYLQCAIFIYLSHHFANIYCYKLHFCRFLYDH